MYVCVCASLLQPLHHRSRVCCLDARFSCILYNNNALKMYFPELSDDVEDEDDDDDASFVCTATFFFVSSTLLLLLLRACDSMCKARTRTRTYEMQVNWLLPFARE